MAIRVELHPCVPRYLKECCNRADQDAFYECLARLRVDVSANSEPTYDPELSRYSLRFFRFGRHIAIFAYNIARDRVRVVECRRIKPRPTK